MIRFSDTRVPRIKTIAVVAAVLTGVSAAPALAQTPAHSGAAQENPNQLPDHIRGLGEKVRPQLSAAVLHRVADYGANYVRLGIKTDVKKAMEPAPTPEDPLLPYRKNIEHLRKLLPVCRDLGLKVQISVVPWGRNQDFFWQKEEGNRYREHLPRFWTAFAKEFKGNPTIVAYNLLSEPNFKRGNEASWREDLLPKAVAAVRAVDPYIWLYVAPGPWGQPSGYKTFEPIDDPYVIYGFHFYAPHAYTHQGVKHYPGDQTYPGMLKQFPGSERIMWDKQQIEAYLGAAIRFKKMHNVRMLCGEFGVVNWAPGRAQWMEDVIATFEANDIGWLSFGWAGWSGWNHSYAPDAPGAMGVYGGLEHTPTLEVVKAGLALNKDRSYAITHDCEIWREAMMDKPQTKTSKRSSDRQ